MADAMTDSQRSTNIKVCPRCGREDDRGNIVCPEDGTALKKQDKLIGTTIAEKYEILSRLGRGGMSIVYKGKHKLMDRIVAVKLLRPELVAIPQLVERFKRESKAISTLRHPNIVTVFDFGLIKDAHSTPFLIMDYLEGRTLDEVLKEEGKLNLNRAVELFSAACDALAHTHEMGIVHRDIKPSNLLLRKEPNGSETLTIFDFGIAKMLQGESSVHKLTASGEVFGSPLYMSPEQAEGEVIDHRTDIYSLACVLHESILGKPPFKGETPLETIMMHMSEPVKAFDETSPGVSVPPALEQVITKALAKKPAKRYQSINEFRDAVAEAMKTIAPVVPTAPGYSPVHGDNTDPNLRFASFSDHGDNSMNNPALPSSTPPMKKSGKLSPIVIGAGVSLVLAVCAAGALIGFNQISGSNPLIVSEQKDPEKKDPKEAGDEKPKEKTKPVTTEAGAAGDADTQKEDRVIIDSIELKKIPSAQLPLLSALIPGLVAGSTASLPQSTGTTARRTERLTRTKTAIKCDIKNLRQYHRPKPPHTGRHQGHAQISSEEAQSWQELSVTFTNQKNTKTCSFKRFQYPRGAEQPAASSGSWSISP
ncbi:MAG: serine/threonine-protein kinase [Cyanobacteriota/Melainabacteria group bacterium]